tara:strand:+ start:393 stop:515 length:123 start_codon:yes stop_codon:yes gene_type:complete
MKKIIILFLIFFIGIVSCGKKGDPVYKKSKNKLTQIHKII